MPGETSYDSGYNYADQINWGKSDLFTPLPQIHERTTMAPITQLPDNPSADQLAQFDKENLAANANRIKSREQMLQDLTRPGPAAYQKSYLVNPYNPLENLGFNLNNTAPSRYESRQMNTWGQINPHQSTQPSNPTAGGPGPMQPQQPYTQPTYDKPQAPAQPATPVRFDPATNPYWAARMANRAANPTTSTTNIIGNTNAPQASTPGGTTTSNSGIYVDNNGNYQFSNTAGGTSPAVAAPAASSGFSPEERVQYRELLRSDPAAAQAMYDTTHGTSQGQSSQPVQPAVTQGYQTSSPAITAWNDEFMRLNRIPQSTATNDSAMMSYYKTIARNSPMYKMPASNFGFAEGGVVGYANGGSVGGIADIAAQGRNGDSMLVHMTPDEVGGLASLAQAHGRPLTTNPSTGLPEAFNLKDWLVPAAIIGAGLLLPGAGSAAAAGAIGGTGAAAGAGAAAAGSLSAGMAMGSAAVTGAEVTAAAGAAGAAAGGAGVAATGSGIAGLGSTVGSAMSSPLGQAGIPAAIKYAQTGDLGQAAAAGAMGWGAGQIMGGLAGAGADAAASTAAPAANPVPMGMSPSVAMPPPTPDMASAMGASTAAPTPGAGTPFNQMVGATPSTLTSPPPTPDAYGSMTPQPAYAPPPPDTSVMGRISDIGGGIKQAVSSQDALGQFAKENKIGAMALAGGAMASNRMEAGQAMQEKNDARKAKDVAERKRVENRIASTYAAQGRAQPQFTRTFAEGGITSQVDGRFMRGEGDGMSDGIPAVINGNQEAALADGEFVIPADVVSNLGNGSSEAGAQQLYAMMERIRQARTGSPNQAKAIAPKKMMPA